MSDTHAGKHVDPVRSRIMSAVRARDTKPEKAVRRLAHALGYRFNLHAGDLPGKPDLVFRGRRKAIFVNGCFWHRHGCRRVTIPATRTDWWTRKLNANVERDRQVREKLAAMGWDTLTIWECEIVDEDFVRESLIRFLSADLNEKSRDIAAGSNSIIGSGTPTASDNDISASGQEGGTDMAPKRSSKKASPEAAENQAQAVAKLTPKAQASARKPTASKARKAPTAKAAKPGKSVQAPAPQAVSDERPLPSRYGRKVDMEAGKVTISKGKSSVKIAMSSYASVANVLAMIEEASEGALKPDAKLEIVDTFSGKRAAVSADAILDVAEVIGQLVLGLRGDEKLVSAPEPRTKAGRKNAQEAVASTSDDSTMPDWFGKLDNEYAGDGYRLVRAELALDPKQRRTVSGLWGETSGNRGWGYEILVDDRRVGWVIAETERSFVLTGIPDFPSSQHRVIEGLMARLTASVMPRLKSAV